MTAPDSVRARQVVEAADHGRPVVGPREFLEDLATTAPDHPATASSARRIMPVRFTDLEKHAAKIAAGDLFGTPAVDLALAAARQLGVSTATLADRYGFDSPSTVSSRVHRLVRRASSEQVVQAAIRECANAGRWLSPTETV